MALSGREKLWLTEEMNLLVTDPEGSAIRNRAVSWVNARLEGALIARIRQNGDIEDTRWERFLAGEEPEFAEVQQAVFSQFPFSREEKKELRLLGKVDKAAVADRMLAYLLKKERTAFQKRAGVTAMAWRRFVNVSGYTSDDVVKKISRGLCLTAEENEFFRSLIFRDTFETTPELKEYVRQQIRMRFDTLTEFLLEAELSENAWEPFRTNPKALPTSQATLLKLILGLHMTRPEGSDLLHRVNSDFVMRRDLATLICIRNGIYDPENCFYILEFFAEGYGGERYYRNLYTDPAEK